jgi:hydrogenase maturation protease
VHFLRDAFPEAQREPPVTIVRIIGIGSPHGDDRIGWEVIEALRGLGTLRRFGPAAIGVDCCDRPGGRLIPLLADADFGILIDAMRSGLPPGTVRRLTPDEVARAELAPGALSCHGFGLGQALALARTLGTLPSRLAVFGVELAETRPGDGLSAPVRAAIPAVVKLVMDEIAVGAPDLLTACREADAPASDRRDAPTRAAR